VDKFEATLVSQ